MMPLLMDAAGCCDDRPDAAAPLCCCRSLLEPIRTSNPFATYVEAACDSLDHEKKVRTAVLHSQPHSSCGAMVVSLISTLHCAMLGRHPVQQRKHLFDVGACAGVRVCAVQVAYCTSAVAFEDGRRPQFEIPYDMVVVAVGEQPATFGVPGDSTFVTSNSSAHTSQSAQQPPSSAQLQTWAQASVLLVCTVDARVCGAALWCCLVFQVLLSTASS
jgi:hypothetical protein